MNLIKCNIDKIKFITSNQHFIKDIEYSPNYKDVPFCIVNSKLVCLDGNKRVKAIRKAEDGKTELLVLQISHEQNPLEQYSKFNLWRKLTTFEYLLLFKNGLNKKVKGFNPQYCSIIIEEMFKLCSEDISFLINSNYSIKSLTETFHLEPDLRDFVLKAAKKIKFSDNELTTVSSGLTHITKNEINQLDLTDKKSFFDSFFPVIHPVMHSLNSHLKKINSSLPKGVSILNLDNFETTSKEMRISFSDTESLLKKLNEIKSIIADNESAVKSKIDRL